MATTSKLLLGCSLSYDNVVNIDLMCCFFVPDYCLNTCNFELGLCSTPSLNSLFGIMAGGDAVPAPVEQPAVVLVGGGNPDPLHNFTDIQ